MAAGDDPEHIVVVKREVPLHVTGTGFQDVVGVAFQGGRIRGIHVPVPFGRAVVLLRAAHQHHFGESRVFITKELAAEAVHFLVQPDFHGRSGPFVDFMDQWGLVHLQARLPVAFPPASGRLVGSPLSNPDGFLVLDQDFIGFAKGVQVFDRNDVAHDQVTLFQESVSIDVHGCSGMSWNCG